MINPVLDIAKLKSIVVILFKGRALKVDRILKNTGIHKKSCWVSYWNKDKRWSTFISKRDLQRAFWKWLTTIELFNLQHNDRISIGWAIYIILNVGDAVFKGNSPNLGEVMDKRLLPKSKYPHILVKWNDLDPVWESAIKLEVF